MFGSSRLSVDVGGGPGISPEGDVSSRVSLNYKFVLEQYPKKNPIPGTYRAASMQLACFLEQGI